MNSTTTIDAPAPLVVEIAPAPAITVDIEMAAQATVVVDSTESYTSIAAPAPPVVEVLGAGLRGPPGPQGVPGGTAYTHTQGVPSTLWTINHDLGFRPAVALFTAGGIAFVGQIQHTGANQTLVHLNTSMSGTARLT